MSWNHFVRLCQTLRSGNFLKTMVRGNSSSASPKPNAPLPATIQKSTTPQMPSEAKDIIMYKYENARFFKILNFFAIAQFGFWGVLSWSSLTLVDVPVAKKEEDKKEVNDDDLPFWRKINLGQDKFKYGLGVGSFLMGYCILFVSWTYILRSVRFLVLRKDRKHVSFVTYAPFGKNRIMDVPLNSISAAGSRAGGTTQMPVKVQNRWLYYILDLKEGQFVQPKLFDQTVGLQRKF